MIIFNSNLFQICRWSILRWFYVYYHFHEPYLCPLVILPGEFRYLMYILSYWWWKNLMIVEFNGRFWKCLKSFQKKIMIHLWSPKIEHINREIISIQTIKSSGSPIFYFHYYYHHDISCNLVQNLVFFITIPVIILLHTITIHHHSTQTIRLKYP